MWIFDNRKRFNVIVMCHRYFNHIYSIFFASLAVLQLTTVVLEMWKPTNLMEALLPIFILDCVFCHGVMPYRSVKKLKINHSLFYSVFSLILYVSSLIIITILKLVTVQGSNMYDVSIQIVHAIYGIVMIINTIISWTLRNKAIKLTMHILKTDGTLKNLGITINIQGEFCFALKVAVSWIFYNVFTCPFVALYDFKNLNLTTKTVVIVIVCHGYFVNLLTILKFFLLIKHMRLRLKNINKVLKNFLKSHSINTTQEETNDRWVTSVRKYWGLHFLCNFRRIHLELGILCRKTTAVYGTQLVFTTIGLFYHILTTLYCQYLRLIRANSDIYEIMLSIVISLVWLGPFYLTFLSVNYICKETVNEWRRTGVILDKLELESKDTEFQTEVRNFSAQVQRNNLKFSPCGFLDLDFYFFRDFTAALSTYLVEHPPKLSK